MMVTSLNAPLPCHGIPAATLLRFTPRVSFFDSSGEDGAAFEVLAHDCLSFGHAIVQALRIL